ncbi:MAG: hypothetical protein EXX96DRAFT_617123 [Benjaminiella poitrasii]|nr:MAG: hypothetical protein EXX96DRAFT_617123 [Benjaminiella poitrasii]
MREIINIDQEEDITSINSERSSGGLLDTCMLNPIKTRLPEEHSTPKDLTQMANNANKDEKEEEWKSSIDCYSPTYKKKWSPQEDELLISYVKKYGYGNWKTIGKHFKTRNRNQCRYRARTLSQLIQFSHKKDKNTDVQHENLLNDSKHLIPSIDFSSKTKDCIPSTDSNNTSSISPTSDTNDVASFGIVSQNDTYRASQCVEALAYDVKIDALQKKDLVIQRDNKLFEHKRETFSKSEQLIDEELEYEIDQSKITDEERFVNTEWFRGKANKTPERYMKIRNHIINSWKQHRPKYLFKSIVLRSLKNVGDLKAIGRVHAYLESINSINVNCSFPSKKLNRKSLNDSDNIKDTSKNSLEYYKKAKYDENYSEEQNMIIEDASQTMNQQLDTFYSDSHVDPFRLIPVHYYSRQVNAPFIVNITSNALLVIDFHSHLAYTEIVGLLGGKVIKEESGIIHIEVEYVFPCHSIGNGVHYEMDPVSEMKAYESFKRKGLKVVGWYYSHPTSEPNPSIRDIANQASYQFLFRDDALNVEPFIGVIITPYNFMNNTNGSEFRFIHISDQWSFDNSYRLPYACIYKASQCNEVQSSIKELLRNLLITYKSYQHKIDMSLSYGHASVTRLEKLLNSINNHLFMEPRRNANFLIEVEQMIHKIFINQD